MARDGSARARVRQLLVTSGPVRDPSGYTSAVLKEAVGYRGSAVAFIQLIAAMERDGEIVREIRGKRTYGIAASEETAESFRAQSEAVEAATSQDASPVAGLEIDYDALAAAILRQLWSAAKSPEARQGVKAGPEQGGPEQAGQVQPDPQRDEYTRRLEAARSQLDELLGPALRDLPASASKG
ncbi:hypothetical protein ACFU96_03150 [Streptomyces sp. NPDC057620]|uniref:hypothetical protein n=1 Tax=Streptomyces sp. NPDC057620 TaxID=3346185 RepID=UPI0036C008A7